MVRFKRRYLLTEISYYDDSNHCIDTQVDDRDLPTDTDLVEAINYSMWLNFGDYGRGSCMLVIGCY
jgi:hypothetical protein